MTQYPPATLFHPTFLYESLWNLASVGLLVWLERWRRGWLRLGDIALCYADLVWHWAILDRRVAHR